MYQNVVAADISGTSLVALLDEDAFLKMKTQFLPDTDIWCSEPERGYDGLNWSFRDEEGRLFNVYTRWGVPRLGAKFDISTEEIVDFEGWMKSL